jgi:hypothetical protein
LSNLQAFLTWSAGIAELVSPAAWAAIFMVRLLTLVAWIIRRATPDQFRRAVVGGGLLVAFAVVWRGGPVFVETSVLVVGGSSA